ncbi:hypothetical protein PsorP6_007316 [Peronosclerospora sorghi]|uniref:Uncharacterized protein n=1 Tax=Peronosclerospora sorghi TaxID=230839 RepID=A0ACC0WDI0_9STRA|nr:hypothetical protein PsorP6_007316 [Peronosclerospora sorghi]
MPTYRGRVGEPLQIFLQQVNLYFSAKQLISKTIQTKDDSFLWVKQLPGLRSTKTRAPSRGAGLFLLKQANCNGLEDYVSRFRTIICQVQDISEINQITWFVHDLVTLTREEMSYRRFATVSNAISVAFYFARSHTQPQMTRRGDRGMNLAEPMESITSICGNHQEKTDFARISKPGHRMNDCLVKSFRGQRKHGPRRVVNSVQILTPILDASKNDESMSFRTCTMNMVRLESKSPIEKENRLIRKKVFVNGRERLIRPGIVDDPGIEHVASLDSFDGNNRHKMRLRAVHATVEMDSIKFDLIALTEYRLPVTHDLILRKRWLTRFNSVIDWKTHPITVSSTTFSIHWTIMQKIVICLTFHEMVIRTII